MKTSSLKTSPWTFRKHLIASLIGGLGLTAMIALVLFLAGYTAIQRTNDNVPNSVAIIGSADGPTAIFVAGNANLVWPALVLFVLSTLILLALYVPTRKWVAKRHP